MVDFEWYRSFVAVYRSGTVTAASSVRALTQPAVSQHLAALETYVGYPLFERTRKKMLPTQQGVELYNAIASEVDRLETLTNNLRGAALEQIPVVRLGVPVEFFQSMLVQKPKPPFKLSIKCDTTKSLIYSLVSGQLDVVIATQPLHEDNLDFYSCTQEEFILVASPDLELSATIKRKKHDIKALELLLLQQSWVTYSVELPIIRRFWHQLFQQRPIIEPRIIIPNLIAIRTCVERGWGISVLPRYLCEEALSERRLIELIQPSVSVINDLWIVNRKADRNKPELRQFMQWWLRD